MSNNNEWQKVGNDTSSPAFKFEKEGDNVSGVFVDVKEFTRPDQTVSKIYTLQQPDGSFLSVWGSAVIDDRMGSIPLGDEVKVVFLGKGKTKSGRNINNFEIFRKPAAAAPAAAPATNTPAVEELEDDEIPF